MSTAPGFDTLDEARAAQDEFRRLIAESAPNLVWSPHDGGGQGAKRHVTGVSIGISRADSHRYRLVVRNRRREAAKAVRAAITEFLPGLIDYKAVSRPRLLVGAGGIATAALGLGASVSHHLDANGSGSAGFFARDNRSPDTVCLVSNAHVLKHPDWAPAGVPPGGPHHTLQPSRGHGGQHPLHRIGQLHDSAPLNHLQLNWIDAAVCALDASRVPKRRWTQLNRFVGNVPAALQSAGQIQSYHQAPVLLLQEADRRDVWDASKAVYKNGAATGWTTGVVTAVEMDFDVPVGSRVYHYKNVLEITGLGQDFASLGDSGAAVVDNSGAVVGLVFGVYTTRDPGRPGTEQTLAYAIPIEVIRIYFEYLELT